LKILMKDYLEEKKYLEIARYCKKIQKYLNISKKDYKGYKNIEIELVPIPKEKLKSGKNIFINHTMDIIITLILTMIKNKLIEIISLKMTMYQK